MSLAFLYVSPSFIVVAHASAHLVIPALFAQHRGLRILAAHGS